MTVLKYAIEVLEQNLSLLKVLRSNDDYLKKCVFLYNGSVAGHVRHSLDHYNKVLMNPHVLALHHGGHIHTGNRKGNVIKPFIAYDVRKRMTDIELFRDSGVSECQRLVDTLSTGPISQLMKEKVQVSFVDYSNKEIVTDSNIERELMFVAHHGIHHISMMKVIMESMGYNINDEKIGLAPSTVESKR